MPNVYSQLSRRDLNQIDPVPLSDSMVEILAPDSTVETLLQTLSEGADFAQAFTGVILDQVRVFDHNNALVNRDTQLDDLGAAGSDEAHRLLVILPHVGK